MPFMLRWICIGIVLSFKGLYASAPPLSMLPITPMPTTIPNNGTNITVIYNVINNTKNPSLTKITMEPIPGVEQILNTTGACNPKDTPASCLLYLVFHGDQTPASIQDGPFIPTLSSRVRPSQDSILQMRTAVPSTQVENTWIKVLIAQDVPPSDLTTYAAKIKKLAPNLEQIHIRVAPLPLSAPNHAQSIQNYANAVTALRSAYPNTQLIVGFHPDTDKTQASCTGWGCPNCPADPRTWTTTQLTCMLDASIQTMNQISALLPANQKFDTYSIEQSYVQPMDVCPTTPVAPCLQKIKACLCPINTSTQNGTACPTVNAYNCLTGVASASPSVTYGSVLASYGGQEIYGPTKLDYGYPQFYNLGKSIPADYNNLISGGFFPVNTTSCHSGPPYTQQPKVVDMDINGAYAPEIPCPITGQPEAYHYPQVSSAHLSRWRERSTRSGG
jgi:hypothetical protein